MALQPPPTGTTRALSATPSTAATTTATTAPSTAPVPPELEQTLGTLTSHRSVLGYLLIARGGPHSASIIRHSGVLFEGEKGKKYAGVIARIVENVQAGLDEVGGGGANGPGGAEENSDVDEVRFMRIRTKRHEIMISPDERYLLAVLHDPTAT